MKRSVHAVVEIILILASVLIFRSLWTLMDKHLGGMDSDVVLGVGLIIGILLAGAAYHFLSHDKGDT